MHVYRVSQDVEGEVHLVIIEQLAGFLDFFARHLHDNVYQRQRIGRFPQSTSRQYCR